MEPTQSATGGMTLRSQLIGAASFVVVWVLLFGMDIWWTAALMGAIAVHEHGHLFAAKSRGAISRGMSFNPFGMMVHLEGIKNKDWPFVALAGPIVGMLVALASYAMYAATGAKQFAAFALIVTYFNGFNLLPLNPLDGGRVAFSAISSFSERAAVAFSLLCCVAAVVMAFLTYGVIFLFIAFLGWMEFKGRSRMYHIEAKRRDMIAEFARLYRVKPTARAILFARRLRERFPKPIEPGSQEGRAAEGWNKLEAQLGREELEKFLMTEPEPPIPMGKAGIWLMVQGLTMLCMYQFGSMLSDVIPLMDAFKMMSR